MKFIEILFVSVGLAMDAFAVAVCKGLCMKKFNLKNAFIISLYFGFFQALMPIIGYYIGTSFEHLIKNVDHWIAFILLAGIGINMIVEAFKKNEEYSDDISFKTMIILSLATSIDALVCGVTFSCLDTKILIPSIIIGISTFILSFAGVIIGKKFGTKLKNKAQIVGGIILIILGIKTLLEHLGIVQL